MTCRREGKGISGVEISRSHFSFRALTAWRLLRDGFPITSISNQTLPELHPLRNDSATNMTDRNVPGALPRRPLTHNHNNIRGKNTNHFGKFATMRPTSG
jgi:hypothetical protein